MICAAVLEEAMAGSLMPSTKERAMAAAAAALGAAFGMLYLLGGLLGVVQAVATARRQAKSKKRVIIDREVAKRILSKLQYDKMKKK